MSLIPDNENPPPVFTASVSIHSGTLPSPETVARYEVVMPGSFDRILTMAEKEQDSKIKINHDTVDIAKHESRSVWKSILVGQTFGFIAVIMYFVLLGLTVLYGDATIFGILCGAGAIVGLPALVRSFQKKS